MHTMDIEKFSFQKLVISRALPHNLSTAHKIVMIIHVSNALTHKYKQIQTK